MDKLRMRSGGDCRRARTSRTLLR